MEGEENKQKENPATTEEPKLLLDEETGEMVTKNELKRRKKARENDKKKQEKDEKKRLQEEEKKKNKKEETKGDESEELEAINDDEEPNKYTENRKNWLQGLRDNGQNPYPHKFKVTHRINEFIETFKPQCPEEAKGVYLNDVCALAGRVHTIRTAGKKLIFYDIIGDHGKIQVQAS